MSVVIVLAGGAAAAATAYDPPKRIGTLRSAELSEVSGIVSSGTTAGVFWVVNDGGHPADVYAINRSGKLRVRVSLDGATNVDWEDIARGPGAGTTSRIYVGDFGDNTRVRARSRLYAFVEPALAQGSADTLRVRTTTVEFRYPGGPRDTEALVVDPRSGRIFAFTKTTNGTGVYRFPRRLDAGGVHTLVPIPARRVPGLVDVSTITGADVSSDGSRVVLRSYFRAWEFTRPRGKGLIAAFAGTPEPVALAFERQGEAVTYSRNGQAIVTTSEGEDAPIWRLSRLR